MENARVTIFSGRDELLNILWPVVLLAVVTVAAETNLNLYYNNVGDWLSFFAGTFFLNTIHIAFTFFMLLFLPETRAWISSQIQEGNRWLLVKWLASTVALVWFFHHWLSRMQASWPAGHRGTLIFLGLAAAHHGLRQYFGISMLYNQELRRHWKLSEEEKQRLTKYEMIERRSFDGCLVTIVLGILALWTPGLREIPHLGLYLALINMIFPAIIFYSALRYPHARKSNKTLFLMRVLFFPIGFLTPFAFVANSCIHGVEYLFVFRKMCRQSKFKATKIAIGFGIAFAAFVTLFYIPNPVKGLRWIVGPLFPQATDLMDWMAAISLGLSFMHYYFDRVMFRMSDPLTRRMIGPLLGPSAALSVETRTPPGAKQNIYCDVS